MIKYIGSKRLLVPTITDVIKELKPKGTVIDLFSGTSRVGFALKKEGYKVISNDINTYATTIARAYIQADLEDHRNVASLIDYMNSIPGVPGYFTETFCRKARFFQPKNGARVDAVRNWLAGQDFSPELEAILLVSIMEAADRVDSTTGVQMAYIKSWAPRAHNDIFFRMPPLLPRATSGKGEAHQMDALVAATTLTGDIAYLDPPYNQHKYIGNYHIWETLVRWDAPEVYGVAMKRLDVRSRKSVFNSRPGIRGAVKQVVEDLDVKHLVVSYSSDGYLTKEELMDILSSRGQVSVLAVNHKRYVGSQIGVYSPGGHKVGSSGPKMNVEYIFTVTTT